MTVKHEKRRGFQPPWYTVTVYTCDCGRVTTLRDSWHGPAPIGAIRCSCGKELTIQ